MTHIMALSGKKQAGKNASANFLFAIEMVALELTDEAFVNKKGQLIVLSDLRKSPEDEPDLNYCEFKPDDRNPQVQQYLAENIWPVIKLYSFADWLKIIANKVLGLTEAQCYGSNDDKNSLTHLRWEDMPGVFTELDSNLLRSFETSGVSNPLDELDGDHDEVDNLAEENNFSRYNHQTILDGLLSFHEAGPMTARQVLQYMGTELFRKMYGQVWVDSCIRQIKQENVGLAIITDCRFPNEVQGVQDAGGKVIRFTRGPFAGEDEHESETALNPENFDWEKFDCVIDNVEMTIPEQNREVFNQLLNWNYISDTEEEVYAQQEKL